MRKTSAVVSFMLVLVFGCSAAFAASAPKYRTNDLNRLIEHEKIVGDEAVEAGSVRTTWGHSAQVASPPPGSPGYRIGSTTYDYQHNGSTGRQVDVTGSLVQATWMKGTLEQLALGRAVNWNKMSVTGSATITLDNLSNVDVLTLGNLGSAEGAAALPTGDRPGYTNFRALPNGTGIAFMHDAPDDSLVGTAALAGVDNAPGIGIFNTNFVPQPVGTLLGEEGIWVHGTVQDVGGADIVHLVGRDRYSAGVNSRVWYWRGLRTGTAVAWETPVLIDSTPVIGQIAEADPNSDKVAIIWFRPIDPTSTTQVFNDVMYRESVNGGVSFGPDINITNSDTLTAGRWAYTDVDAAYDDDGTLHIVYNTRDYREDETGELAIFNTPADLLEWNDVRGTSRVITSANWSNSCNEEDNPFDGGAWNLLVCKPNIVVKPENTGGIAAEILYAVWVQFGPTDTPAFLRDCATQSDSVTQGGMVNGEIYCSASSNDGLTWDRPFNLTGTVTDSCAPGDCHSEHWVTAAARADSGIYLSYTDDSHAGGIPQDEGAWSLSNYMLYVPKVRVPIPEPRIAVTPIQFTELNVNSTGTPDTVFITVSNVGNSDLNYTINVQSDDGGPTFVQVENSSSHAATILSAGNPDVLEVVFDGNGLANPSEQNWRLEVTSNDAENDPGAGGVAIDVDLNVFVADVWFTCAKDTISTGQRRMAVSSCLELGDQGSGGGLYAYADEREWVYDASPTLSYRPSSGTPTVYRDVFYSSLAERSRDSNRAFRAQSGISVARDTLISNGDTTFLADRASGVASSTDSIFQVDWTATTFKDPTLVNGAVFHYTLSPKTSDGIGGAIVMGSAADLDVDSLSGSNDGIADATKQYVGGQGGYGDTLGFVGQNNFAALFYIPLDTGCSDLAGGGQVLDNVDYIYPENGYVDDTLLNWYETNLVGWSSTTEQQDTITDINVVMKDRGETWTNSETYEWSFGLAVSDVSQSDLENTIARLRTAANSGCLSGCPITLTGDVNVSGAITSADIIYMVGFVFKGGPGPNPCDAAGDVNCSGAVTSADIIFMVGFVFKGGPAPCDGCTSALVSGC